MKPYIITLITASWFLTASAQVNSDFKWKVGENVISHYMQHGETQKAEAAKFLISNMSWHRAVGSNLLDKYFLGIKDINIKEKYPQCANSYKTLRNKLGDAHLGESWIYDLDVLTEEELMDNIDSAFSDWKCGLWANHLTFEQFCEYLLPYRIGNEKYLPWRKELREKFYPTDIDLVKCDDLLGQSYWAACRVNDKLKRELGCHISNKFLFVQRYLPAAYMKDLRTGDCYDYAKLTAYVMRACGIPVSLDFTPQWPDRSHYHFWNSLLDNTGMSMPFMGCESNPGYPCKPGRKYAKVYRYTFAYQPQSLFAKNDTIGQLVPDNLNTPFIKDVSSEYFKGHSISVELNGVHPNDKFAYISVFNNQEWVPVDFAEISENQTATFKNLGTGIAYLPTYWGRNGVVPAGDIVVLEENGEVRTMAPDTSKLQSIELTRKFPLFERAYNFRRVMDYGVFEAANQPDFSDAVKCAEIGIVPNEGHDVLQVSTHNKYRYWRYKAGANNRCCVSEILFYKGNKPITVVKVLSEGEPVPGTKPGNVFDGKTKTYFENRMKKGGWVGADLGMAISVDSIAYHTRSDENDVVSGQNYELCYFKEGKPNPLTIQRAKDGKVIFEQVPSNAVYILHNIEKGTEERIFTYEKNKIKWF